ncbi:MAG: hypothetical protein EAZ91_15655 [Cytophagales bacterium]|nr:MAG: hypothetical protein EAZ91_15655 [Cytophagales bacterium]
MQKRLWLVLIGLVVVLGGWGLYRLLRPSDSLARLVPPDALIVLESSHLLDSNSVAQQRKRLTINQIPLFEQATYQLGRSLFAALDSAIVRRFVRGKAIRCSLHPTGKTKLDFLFYIPLRTNADRQFVERLLKPNPDRFRVQTRPFDGERVSELTNLRNESLGNFLVTDNALICSASGVLVENVTRQLNSFSFNVRSPELLTDTDQLAAMSVRPEVLQRLFGTDSSSLVRVFLPENLTIRFRGATSRTHLVGYASDQIGSRTEVADLFKGQTPDYISASDLIPQNTSSIYHIRVSDGTTFGKAVGSLLAASSGSQLRQRLDRIAPATPDFYKAVGTDIMLCRMESPDGRKQQVLVVQGRKKDSLARAYQQIAYRAGALAPAPPKTFLGHKTILLKVDELPASLFTGLFSGFRESWVTQHGNALIVANGEDVMQEYLQQITQGFVWSADERQQQLLTQTLRPANFTAFVRLNRSGQSIPDHWPTTWQSLLGRPSTSFENLENMVYQASYGNENINSTLVLGRTTRRASKAVVNQILLRGNVPFNAPLIAAPVVVGSLSDGSAQFYAQNQAGQFVLVTPEGDKIVQDTTDGPIRSNVIATDFLDNGRLQYLFMTDRRLYVAQPGNGSVRLERIRLPAGLDPTYLASLRGSRQPNFVVLAAHRDGHIYALDRKKRAFVRLMTATSTGPLLLPFQVLNGPTGMEILALQANGTLNRWQDNGQPVAQYPAKLDLPFVSPALLPANNPLIQAITEAGEILQIRPNGLIASRNQLYRPVRSGSFRLVPDEGGQTWLLMLTSDTEATILDQQGNPRFSIQGLVPGQTKVRYHRLGGGVEIISVKSGDKTTLYTPAGKQVGENNQKGQIKSDFPVALQYDESSNELYILTGLDKAVQLFSIRLK